MLYYVLMSYLKDNLCDIKSTKLSMLILTYTTYKCVNHCNKKINL